MPNPMTLRAAPPTGCCLAWRASAGSASAMAMRKSAELPPRRLVLVRSEYVVVGWRGAPFGQKGALSPSWIA